MYNDYNYGNDMGSTPQSFGGGSGTEYYGGSAPQSFGGGNPSNPSNLYEDYRNSPRRPLNSYESYRNWPRQDEQYHTPNYAPASYDGYGRSRQGRYDTPPRRVQTWDEEDAQFQRELEEATRQSREEYICRLEEENSFYRRQHNNLYDVFSREPYSSGVGPSRRHDTDSEEE